MDNATRAEVDRLTADHPAARAAWHRLAAERGSVKKMRLLQRLRWWARAAGTLLRAAWRDEFRSGTGAAARAADDDTLPPAQVGDTEVVPVPPATSPAQPAPACEPEAGR